MSSTSSDRAPAPPTRDATEGRLRAEITRGELAPGHRLVESTLVESYGASRSTVRLAIDTMIAEGLVERLPHRSARVRSVSLEDAVAITECRMALEGLLARRAAQRIRDDEVAELRTRVAGMRAAVDAGDLVRYAELIVDLLAAIRATARHAVASDLVERLQAQIVRHQFRLSLRPGRAPQSLEELDAVVEAVVGRDPEAAEVCVRRHLTRVVALLGSATSEPTAMPELRR